MQGTRIQRELQRSISSASNIAWTRGFQFKRLLEKLGWETTDSIYAKLVVYRQLAKVTSKGEPGAGIPCAHVGEQQRLLAPVAMQQTCPATHDNALLKGMLSKQENVASHPYPTDRQGLRSRRLSCGSLLSPSVSYNVHLGESKSASVVAHATQQLPAFGNLGDSSHCACPPIWMQDMHRQTTEMFRLVLEVCLWYSAATESLTI
jgi:hypothetical protein